MPLALDQIKRGTQVAIAFDDEGRRLKIQRRGVIVQIDTVKKYGRDEKEKMVVLETEKNGNPRAGISKIWVSLNPNEPPVEVKNSWLALVREGKHGDFLKVKAAEEAALAAAIESGAVEQDPDAEPLKLDETQLEHPGKPISPAELERLKGPTTA